MRAVVTIAVLACSLAITLMPSVARAQGITTEEAQALREEIRRLNERLNRMEQAGQPSVIPAAQPAQPSPAAPVTPATPVAPATAQVPAPVPGRERLIASLNASIPRHSTVADGTARLR